MQRQHERSGDIAQFLQSLNHEEGVEHEADIPEEELSQPNSQQGADEEIPETIHVYFVREEAAPQKDVRIVDCIAPGRPQHNSDLPAYAAILFGLFLTLSSLAFQLYLVFNPPIATITLVPRSQTISLSGTLQLGRIVSPLTLSQSQTVPTTGKGHQAAKQAQGTITFYNGQFASVTIATGTILTGASGLQISTDQDATIPPGNPPSYGQVSVPAHATRPGVEGNIPAYDINQACCASAILAKNTTDFTGGQIERDFSTVSQQDIHTLSTQLIPTLIQSMQAALLGQIKPSEQLQLFPCAPTVTSDHQPGQEATQVKVTVSQTCSGVAYATQALAEKASALLSQTAVQKLGTGYGLLGQAQVSVTQASVTHATPPLVFLSFHAQGIWDYAVGKAEQEQLKHLIAGRTKQEALRLLSSLPGIKKASIAWGDDSKLPKNSSFIHISLFVM